MIYLNEPKLFTWKEACGALVFVRKVVEDILELSKEPSWQELILSNSPRFSELYQELNLVGCHLRDAGKGIVGFYGKDSQGDIVEWCWFFPDKVICWEKKIHSIRLHRLGSIDDRES